MQTTAFAALLVALVLGGCVGTKGPGPGEPAPDFALAAVDGGLFRLSEHRGDVVLLDFTGARCQLCDRQMETLLALEATRGAQDGWLLVSIDNPVVLPGLSSRSTDELVAFRDRFNASWTFAADTAEARVGPAYQIVGLPTLFLVDRSGGIALKSPGLVDGPCLEAALATSLESGTPEREC